MTNDKCYVGFRYSDERQRFTEVTSLFLTRCSLIVESVTLLSENDGISCGIILRSSSEKDCLGSND